MSTDELEAKARLATVGPWVLGGLDESGNRYIGAFCQSCRPPCWSPDALVATAGLIDAEYIAAANPEAVLALIAENRDLKQRAEKAESDRSALLDHAKDSQRLGIRADCTPTVLGGTDYTWWSEYMRRSDQIVRETATRVLREIGEDSADE